VPNIITWLTARIGMTGAIKFHKVRSPTRVADKSSRLKYRATQCVVTSSRADARIRFAGRIDAQTRRVSDFSAILPLDHDHVNERTFTHAMGSTTHRIYDIDFAVQIIYTSRQPCS
jgi:hypothetical protein